MNNYKVIKTNDTWFKEQTTVCLGLESSKDAVEFFAQTQLCSRWELDSRLSMVTVNEYYVMAEEINGTVFGRFVNPATRVVYMVEVRPQSNKYSFEDLVNEAF